ncbi:MAG TPA: LuxR C-terminal-related transcriptional regulator [Actinomycetota bacterium]|nr:LuxR C-terminal-related transcriptional regulator [Actinomycetota bacterium]
MSSALVVSGDRLFGEAAAAALTEAGWDAAFVPDGLAAVASMARSPVDALLVLGETVPRLGAVPLVQQARRRWPATTVVVVGNVPEVGAVVLPPDASRDEVVAALGAEPAAAVDEPARSRDGIAVLAGLTQRQRVVLRLLVEGLDMRAIGVELGLSEHTVRTHMQNLYARLGCHSRLELVRFATSQGLLAGDPPSSG